MAIIKKYNPKHIFLPDRIRKKYDTILDYSISIIEAPTGYGKTTSLSEYLSYSEKKYIWFNIDNCDKEQFFSDFCAKVEGFNADIANEMRKIGYPVDEHTSGKLANLVMQLEFNKKTILVIDNYNFVADKHINNVFKDLSGKKDLNLIIVLVTETISNKDAYDVFASNKVNYITKSDFMFDKKDIDEYYKVCGIKLDDSEIDYLYKTTEGWISALYIQVLNYAEYGSFEYNLGLNNLIYKTIWRNLSIKEQEFFIGIGMFDCFSVRQA